MSDTYIFVSDIDTAGKGCMAVNHADFPVVPVVLLGGEKGAEGVEGPGIGEFFEVTQLDHGGWVPIFSYNEMCIVNGYAKNETVWQENNRVKSMKLYFENEYMGTITLEDTMQPQYIDLSPVNITVGNGCEARFRLEITEVYPGTKYDDTCVSGVIVEYEGRSH